MSFLSRFGNVAEDQSMHHVQGQDMCIENLLLFLSVVIQAEITNAQLPFGWTNTQNTSTNGDHPIVILIRETLVHKWLCANGFNASLLNGSCRTWPLICLKSTHPLSLQILLQASSKVWRIRRCALMPWQAWPTKGLASNPAQVKVVTTSKDLSWDGKKICAMDKRYALTCQLEEIERR